MPSKKKQKQKLQQEQEADLRFRNFYEIKQSGAFIIA